MQVQRDIFATRGAESSSRPQFALPVINQVASQLQSGIVFTAGTHFTVPAGAAGAAVTIKLPYGTILGNYGRTGNFGNSSLTLGGALATTLTTEVAFIADAAQRTGDVTNLSNGQFMVDYETGIIYGKRADTGTTGTATYSFWAQAFISTGSGTFANQVQGTAASGSAAVGNPVQGGGVYNTSAPTLSNGNVGAFQLDVNANLKTVGQYMPVAEDNANGVYAVNNLPVAIANYAWSADLSAALEASTVTKATAGLLRQITGRIDSSAGTATYYLHVYNASSLPADGAVTFLITPIKIAHTTGTNTNFTVDLTMNGVYASTGIVVALSSTEFTKTITGALISTLVLYK